jgi:hypothetical protein
MVYNIIIDAKDLEKVILQGYRHNIHYKVKEGLIEGDKILDVKFNKKKREICLVCGGDR